MDSNNISEIFNLSNSYQTWIVEDVKKKVSLSKSLLEKFSVIYESEKEKLPYRLNLLDDLSTNENAHSKFLIRLLQYQPALINFLTFINKNSNSLFSFDVDNIQKPILTSEKMRIDGLIQESNKYAIIIENKIHGAAEQEHQLGRYIDKCKTLGFKVKQIYILYLTRTERENHSEQTWGNEYKLSDFHKRYFKLSYKSEILPWLENYLIDLSAKEELIKSAVTQYIDHLKHFFNNKEIYSNMNAELQKFLAEELKFSTDNIENIEVVSKKIHEINELSEQLKVLATTSKNELFKAWRKNIDDFFDFEENKKFIQLDSRFIKTGVVLSYKGISFSILIEHNFSSTYYGIGRHHASEQLDQEVKEFFGTLLKEESLKEDSSWWHGWKYTSFSNGYLEFENLLKIVLERINSTK